MGRANGGTDSATDFANSADLADSTDFADFTDSTDFTESADLTGRPTDRPTTNRTNNQCRRTTDGSPVGRALQLNGGQAAVYHGRCSRCSSEDTNALIAASTSTRELEADSQDTEEDRLAWQQLVGQPQQDEVLENLLAQ